jgi:chemotaxis protein methyltransferase CheR
VRDLIEQRCGLRFDDSQRTSLSSSVSVRMQQLGIAREEDYLNRLRGATSSIVETELRNLLNLVTVTETCFFRDAAQFRLLREHIIPVLMAERSMRPDIAKRLRIWSAGCSSGEEAYSIAITLEEMGVYAACPDWSIEIIGTDLNTTALDKARRGIYTARAVRNVEGRLLDNHFVRDGKTFALSSSIKNRVTFEFGNLTQTPMPPTGPQDVVFCKNVAIYFRTDVARKLIEGLRDTLAPDGYLLLGHAESLWQMSDGFTLVEHERAFCYRKTEYVAVKPTTCTPETDVPATHVPATYVVSAFRRTVPTEPVRLKPDTAYKKTQYDASLASFREGDWDVAESLLSALVASSPTFVPALLLLGGLYVHRGRLEDAKAQAETVLKVSDLEARAHLLLGMIAARVQRHDEALQSLRRALYLDDSLALGHFWLGNLYRERGDVVRACHEYENVVRDWERNTLQFTEEFASDLTAEQLVAFCADTLERLQRQTVNAKR